MKKASLILLSIFLMLGILLTGCKKDEHSIQFTNKGSEQLPEKKNIMQEYLKENYRAIDLEDESNFADLAIMDSDIQGKEIFFTAEIHGTKANEQLNMKFLKYFKEKTDFRYYLCELSFSDAYFINKYLDTGDIKILEEIYKPLKGTFAWNKDAYKHWKKLYEYNNTLPKESRIEVIGIDIEHQPINAYRFLVDVLPEAEAPEEIKVVIDKIKSTSNDLEKLDDRTFIQCSEELQKDMKDKGNVYKEYLEENFTAFNLVNLNVLNKVDAYNHNKDQVDWNNTRDKMIYENFQTLQKELPKGKYYGQWGFNHTFQSKEKDIMWFATYLNSDDSLFKDKILTVIYNYDNCEKIDISEGGRYVTHKFAVVYPQIKETNDLLEGNFNIYKLTGENTPFSKTPMYYTSNGEELEASMLEFFQYIVCIRNSKATDPLNDEYN
ncbi:erythromycin esterase family protein [Clostridium algidicarnis]|uniref:erythromycin esterase family protein n=1 Tax=Clostridium algidicarnis TaxID=37659 RepID=UPI001C0E02B8|nr:erythromycin esterase family protein [Clostridium algidicarnis]MBU3204890.1 erythromycin esterase family protein [Clostridium algidicarnis]MBU3213044.1 erythromycin esterase family protein [Clostridium algidicarnis]MBU3223700.1 erythromycin esterase family protein [Clostridium algidicarnis]